MEKSAIAALLSPQSDFWNRASRLLVLGTFAIAIVTFIAAPLLAIAWQNNPFPGFLVDQTLVVNGNSGSGWGPQTLGINYLERVTRVAGHTVTTSQQFANVIRSFQIGDRIQVFTITADGVGRLYPDITLISFPDGDLMRMFWLPYLIGIAYLAIGAWIYRLRGDTRPGRALAFFCVVTAIASALIFDVSTTHAMTLIWTFAIAQVGGALISLALRFPEEWFPVRYQPWILTLPYFASFALAIWGFRTLYDQTNPWAYVPMWEACQRYAGLGSVIFLLVILYRAFAGHSAIIRRQARLMVVGSVLAFIPITIWFVAPLFNLTINFEPGLFLPTLLLFPISVALAILRYRLWSIDDFVNYAFVYGASTAILAGVFAALTSFGQRLFVATTGAKSDTATVIITLLIATAFTPLKGFIQKFVDRHLSEESDKTIQLRSFGDEVQAFVQMQDVILLSQRLLTEVTVALGAESGVLSLLIDGKLQPIQTVGLWKGNVNLSVPLDFGGQRYGILQLGPHQAGRAYSNAEGEAVQTVAAQVAHAVSLAWPRYMSSQLQRWENSQRDTSLTANPATQERVTQEREPSRI